METPDLGLLVYLDALLQEGSVTRAARRVGLSVPAMSHALTRLRERLEDPLLVRSGRGMVLTPRAEALREQVHSAVLQAHEAMTPRRPFVARELKRTFVIHCSDYVLTLLGATLDTLFCEAAPEVALRFVPNTPDDATLLREGGADLAVGIYGELPPEMRSRLLLTDRFVVVLREGHPSVGPALSLEEYAHLRHVQIAPRGKPGGYVDDVLASHGLSRRVARSLPAFLAALNLVAQTDYLLTVSERIALRVAPELGLRVLEAPMELRPYALSLLWHPRFDGDPAHQLLRELFVRSAQRVAADRHTRARTRLQPSRKARRGAGS